MRIITSDYKAFMMSCHFSPRTLQQFGLNETDKEGLYFSEDTDSYWVARYLYDLGWGNEIGYVRQPELNFSELIYLMLLQPALEKGSFLRPLTNSQRKKNRIIQDNIFGAAAVIMEDYSDELVGFLEESVKNGFLRSSSIHNAQYPLGVFSFSTAKSLERGWAVGSTTGYKSYEEILNENETWRRISQRVIEDFYGKQ